jgi:hypothetical protein
MVSLSSDFSDSFFLNTCYECFAKSERDLAFTFSGITGAATFAPSVMIVVFFIFSFLIYVTSFFKPTCCCFFCMFAGNLPIKGLSSGTG